MSYVDVDLGTVKEKYIKFPDRPPISNTSISPLIHQSSNYLVLYTSSSCLNPPFEPSTKIYPVKS